MKLNIKPVYLIILLFFQFNPALTQSYPVDFSFGLSIQHEYLPEKTSYQPYLFLLTYKIYHLPLRDESHQLDFYAEPQINVARLMPGSRTEWEYGMNVGIRYGFRRKSMIYIAGIGAGPHYLSLRTNKQAGGFIFSDNLYFGIRKQLKGFRQLHLQLRWRHLSNANLKQPNTGINNWFLVFGFSKMIGKRTGDTVVP